ncbi:MAG: hypothetical protein B7Z15_01205 [Rhizobiales bacterium 32-66-8]|jgi:hypothetical protein|nr:MAG: hypothetical protein B7Z15_01205 [Rhizobiales bacterium 32-66-8]
MVMPLDLSTAVASWCPCDVQAPGVAGVRHGSAGVTGIEARFATFELALADRIGRFTPVEACLDPSVRCPASDELPQ